MELTLKMHDYEMSIKTESDDITISEMFDSFGALLIAASFSQTQIDNYIIDKAAELEEIKSESQYDND